MEEFRVTAQHGNASVDAVVEAEDKEEAKSKVTLHPDAEKNATPLVETEEEETDDEDSGPVVGEPI